MLETRENYGYAKSTGTRNNKELKKWHIAYRCDDGSFGIIGWLPLFDNYEDAQKAGEKIKREWKWIKEIIIQHPSRYYSNY